MRNKVEAGNKTVCHHAEAEDVSQAQATGGESPEEAVDKASE